MSRTTGWSVLGLFTGLLLTGAAAAEEISGYTGAEAYQRFCASCHGRTGEGNGPVSAEFRAQVPDLTQLAKRRGGQYPAEAIRRIIDGTEVRAPHGSREMPVWGHAFWVAQGSDENARREAAALIDRLVQHLATLQR